MQNRCNGDREGRGGGGWQSKRTKKLQNALENKQNQCKTVALAIETVAAAAAVKRK